MKKKTQMKNIFETEEVATIQYPAKLGGSEVKGYLKCRSDCI